MDQPTDTSVVATPITEGVVKKPPKLLYALAGVAIILVTIALAITFFGGGGSTSVTNTDSADTSIKTDGFKGYSNTPHFFSIEFPPSWVVVETTPSQEGSVIVQTDAQAIMKIDSFAATSGSLDEYLSGLVDGRTASKTTAVKVGSYDGFERLESWTKTSLQPVITYIQIQDKIYIFSLLPASGKNAITSESLLRDYRSVLSTFKLTSTAQLGQDWKEYTSSKVDNLAYPAITFTHPQSWAVTEKLDNGTLTVSIYRNNYEISIAQAAVGGAVCLFKDSPAFQGSSGDLRSKEYTEFQTSVGGIMRRYFNQNQGEKSSFFFCQKGSASDYFETPTQLGGIVYYVPAKYDTNIIQEMDSIVKTFAPASVPTPTPSSP